jgi:hypothetical protein
MTEILKIQDDNDKSYNLLTGTIRLIRGGYAQKTAVPNFEHDGLPYGGSAGFVKFQPMAEVIQVAGTESPTNLLAAERNIQGLLERARDYFTDPLQPAAVWLYNTSQGEYVQAPDNHSKRALIYHGTLAIDNPDKFTGSFLNTSLFGQLVIMRHPLWEDADGTAFIDDNVGVWADTSDMSGDAKYMGNAPARVAALTISGFTNNITKLWFGIRPAYKGFTDFDPMWELENGTNGTDTTTQTVTGASGGDAKRVTFSTATLTRRVTIQLSQAHTVSNYIHFMGRYLVLCRCKVDASTECGIRMHHGFVDTPYAAQEEVLIDNTAWQLIELGEVTIPPRGWRAAGSFFYDNLSGYAIGLDAERLSGTGYLYLDALYFIPAEYMIAAQGLSNSFVPIFSVITTPDDQVYSLVRSTAADSIPRLNPAVAAPNWWIPVDPGFAVVAAQPDTDHSLTETCDLTFNYRPRWKTYRTEEL